MDAHPVSHPTDRTLLSYGQGQLDGASARSVGQHLEACPDCRRRVTSLSFAGSSADGLSLLGAAEGEAPAPPPETLPPGLADHPDYEVLRELGQGGMGVVYLARNELMGRLEVLKVVSGHLVKRPQILERFLGEIRNAAQLHHPNIVTAYSATRLGESFVLAMEYVDGFDLSRVVKARGPLRVANACYYIHQASLGLQHAHEHGMVHRDIKPGNLIVARQGKRRIVKVLDFGLAKVQSERSIDSGLTHEGQMLGTPDYIAPEQISNARHADIRADIYSLGCTFYYLLTGRPPFKGASLYDILQAHHSMEATPLNQLRPDVPAQVAAIVAKMMAKEPEQRFQEPREVAQALVPFINPGEAALPGSKPIEVVRPAVAPPPVPVAGRPRSVEAPPVVATLIETPEEIARARLDPAALPVPAIAALVVAVLASLMTGLWIWAGRDRDRAGADRIARAPEPAPVPPAVPKATPPVPRPPADDPEDLIRDAMADLRRGNVNQARLLLNQYLARAGAGKRGSEARAILRDIDLATSSMEAEALSRRLSDRELVGYLASGGQPLVDTSVQTPDLRRVYARTLLEAFRQETDRRRSAPKASLSLARSLNPATPPAPAHVPRAPVRDEADRLPAKLLESDDDRAPAPRTVSDRTGPTTIETILDAPRSFEGRTIPLDGMYKVGTLLTPIKGPDGGQSIGSSLAVGGADDRLICKGDGKVNGRTGYLVLDRNLASVLLKAFNEFRFHPASRPSHKSTLTVTVRHVTDNGTRVPVVSIVGMEILGVCNLVLVAQRQYEKAFWTVHVTPESATVAYGEGAAWVERLGGEEKFIKPLRRKLRDLQRKAIADRQGAIVGSMLQAELARSVNMAAASQAQQARFAAAVIGVR